MNMLLPVYLSFALLVVPQCFGRNIDSELSSDPYNDVEYVLYTNRNTPYNFRVDVDPQKLLENGFDPSKLTKIIVHGWVIGKVIF